MALIELKQLGKTFKGKTQTVEALKGISLEIEKGDIYGIIGMSGAGKSTLVRCINFLEKPTEGSVIIDGKDLSSLTDKELRKLRRQVSMIFQHFNLLQQRNVRGNISFAMEIAGLDAETRRTYIREMLEHDESVYARVLTKPAAFKEYFIRYGGADFRKVKQYPGYAWQTLVYAKDRIAFVLRKFLAPAVTYIFTQLAVAASGAGKLTGDERAARLIEIAVPEKPEKQISAAKREKLSFKQRAINVCGIIAEAAKRAWSAVSGWFKAAKAAISADGAKAFFKNLGSAIVRSAKKAWAKTVCGAKAFIAWLKPATARVSAAIALSASGIIKAHRNERIDELLDIVSLKERQFNYPSQLSGGQQQRVAIARALANNPQIILCDEATSALDPTTTTQILNLLREINRNLGITIVIITHEMKVVESICSHVAIIDNGVLAENGTVERIFKHPETEVARKLIFRKDGASAPVIGERVVRVVFDGQESTEPVIANLILECGIAVNIMHADTRDVGGRAFGQMLLQLPEDKLQQEKAIYYLRTRGLTVEDIKEAAE